MRSNCNLLIYHNLLLKRCFSNNAAKEAALKACTPFQHIFHTYSGLVREAEKAAAAAIPTINLVEGQPMLNINIMNDGADPICQPLDKYPKWLEGEINRPRKIDPYLFQKEGRLPTRTELRLLNKMKIKANNS